MRFQFKGKRKHKDLCYYIPIMKRTSEKKEDYNKANPYLHV